MTNRDYIKKKIQEHIIYEQSIQRANSAFSTEYYHPKTGKRITWSEQCTLVDKHFDKIIKEIEKKFDCNSK